MPSPEPLAVSGVGRRTAACVALAAIYGFGAWFEGTFLARDPGPPLIWIPGGLTLAALLLGGPRLWPGAVAGAAIVAMGSAGLLQAATGLVGDLAEIMAAWALSRWGGFSPRLDRPRDLLLLLAVAGVSATLGSTGSVAMGDGSLGLHWWQQWLGHAGSMALVTPLVLVGFLGTPSWGALARRPEYWTLLALSLAAGLVVFGGGTPPMTVRLAAVFVPFLALVWAGLRMGSRGAGSLAALVAALALAGRAHGTGPMGERADLSLLWVYLLSLSVTAIVLPATVAQRDAADRARWAAASELADQIRQAQRLEGIGLLAGGIAHDFNNLLMVIRANLNLLEPVGRQREYVSEMDAATGRAADLCRQLMTYAGRQSSTMGPVDLARLVEELGPELKAAVPEPLRVELESTPSAPARADPAQLRQVLFNLVANAAEASGSAGAIRVRTGEVRCDARYLRHTFLHSDAEPGIYGFVEVADDGRGMDEATLRRLFEPFFTTKPNKRGLGLMTVAGVARGHGGAIKVASAAGQGSTFRLLVPQWSAVARPPPTPEETPGPQPARVAGIVLVGDDEPAVLRAATRILRRSGYEVLTARNGLEAVEVYRANADRIEAVLLDYTMPGQTGLEAVVQIRKIAGRAVPAVLMSGNPPDRMPEAAGLPVLMKPFGIDSLLEQIRVAVAAGRPTGEP